MLSNKTATITTTSTALTSTTETFSVNTGNERKSYANKTKSEVCTNNSNNSSNNNNNNNNKELKVGKTLIATN